MSLTAADRKWITDLVKQQVSIILSGNTAATQVNNVPGTESIDNLFPGCPTVEGRPVAHPYGLVSRAPKGTAQVTARQGEHPANRIVLLHRDKNRPAIAEGDVWLYDAHGNQVKLIDGKVVVKASKIELGEGATKGVARLGDEVQVTLTADDMLTIAGLLVCTAPGNPPTTIAGTVPGITGAITGASANVTAVD